MNRKDLIYSPDQVITAKYGEHMKTENYVSLVLVCAFLACMLPAVFAADDEPLDEAIQLYHRGDQYVRGGDYQNALIVLDQALALNTSQFISSGARQYALIDKSKAQSELNDYDGALQTIDTALSYEESDMLWYNKGYFLLRLGRNEEAVNAFNKAIKMKPDYEIALINRGNALLKLGKYQEAIDSFTAGLAADAPHNDLTLGFRAKTEKNIGDAYTALGKYPEAISAYKSSLVNDPGNAETTAALAKAQQQMDAANFLTYSAVIVILIACGAAGYYLMRKKADTPDKNDKKK